MQYTYNVNATYKSENLTIIESSNSKEGKTEH